MLNRLIVLLVFALIVQATGIVATSQVARTLTSRWLLDVETGRIIENGVIVVRGQTIVAVGSRAEITAQGESEDLGNVTLMPGMIDSHVHLALGGRAEANARATIAAGFTTVQDLGALNYQAVTIRDAIRDGAFPGPRVIASGPWLGVIGGTCDFQDTGVRGAQAFRERVIKDVAEGADLIKVCASGWLAQAAQDPTAFEISDEELRAAVDEAHRLKRRVAVHATSERAIAAAVSAGADLIAHGGFTADATVAAMKQRRIYQLPTMFSFKANAPAEVYERLQRHLAGAVRQGLPVAFGTDAGVIPHGDNGREFEQLAASGMSALDVIRAATVHAASAVGLAGEIGVLKMGRLADVIGVDGNPLADVAALRRVRFVMKEGVVISR